MPAKPVVQAPAVSGPVTAPPLPPVPEKVAEAPPAAKAETKPEPKSEPEAKPEPKPVAKADEGAKAKALLEGKPEKPAAAADGRFVVQVGAFADQSKAREARLKVERAGLKTYTHVAETKEGKRIRVRVGPFGSRAEADKAPPPRGEVAGRIVSQRLTGNWSKRSKRQSQ